MSAADTAAAWAGIATAVISLQVGLFTVARRVDRWREGITDGMADFRREVTGQLRAVHRRLSDVGIRDEETRRRFVRLERHVGLPAWEAADISVTLRTRSTGLELLEREPSRETDTEEDEPL